MLLSKKQVLVILGKDSFTTYTSEGKTNTHKLSEKEESRKKDTVLALAKADLEKGEVTIILSEEVFSQRVFPFTNKEEAQTKSEEFFKELGFEESDLVKKILISEKEVYCLATKRSWYESVVEGFTSAGFHVVQVVPLAVVTRDNAMFTEDIMSFFKSSHDFSVGDFLGEHPINPKEQVKEETQEKERLVASPVEENSSSNPTENDQYFFKTDETPKKKSPLKTILLFVVIVIIAAVIGFVGLSQYQNLSKIQNVFVKPTPTSVPTQAPTPTVAPLSKSDLNVEVLNGTGTVGQAGVVKSLLVSAGYTKITTDNADTQDHTSTTITITPNVSQAEKDEIQNLLKSSFPSVSFESATSGATYNVVIVTGK